MSDPHLYSLVYRSRATRELSPDELEGILATARERNQARSVSGLLIHLDGQFIQLLEGPEGTVLDLYQEIARDPRHTRVTVLMQGPIRHRATPGWSMAFQRVSEADVEELPGFSDFLADPEALPRVGGPEEWSTRLLHLFKSAR